MSLFLYIYIISFLFYIYYLSTFSSNKDSIDRFYFVFEYLKDYLENIYNKYRKDKKDLSNYKIVYFPLFY